MAFGGAKIFCKVGLFGAIGVVAFMAATADAKAQPAGSQPQVPISRSTWLQHQGDPAALQSLSANLPALAAEPGPSHGAPLADPPAGGTWSNLANSLGFNASNPLLLTDGTVIVHRTDTRDWWKLTPDSSGSYINGTWSQIASMQSGYGPKFHASAVLPDGRVIVEGGEYNLGGSASWTNQGSIYDPVANTWTAVSPPSGWTSIGDAQSTLLANGTFFLADCCSTKTALFNPNNCCSSSAWTSTGTSKADWNDEESWSLLPDGTVLTTDAYVSSGTCGTNTERYNSGTGAWSSAGNVPAQLSDCNTTNTEGGASPSYEIGPQIMMYNGKLISFGGTTANVAHTALYTTSSNTWAAGPDLPSTCNAGSTPCTLADAPAVLLPNGNVLFVASHGKFHNPAKFFEYDPTGNSYAAVSGTSDAASITSFYVNFLILPNGQIFACETYTATIQIYTPSGSPVSAAKPAITSVSSTLDAGTTYTLTGTQLSGLSQGANYGDDQQASTNYPIVRVTNNATGHVFYGKTWNFSTVSINPGTSATASFKLGSNTETGASTFVVIANGIASNPTSVTVTNTGGQLAVAGPIGQPSLDVYGPPGGPFWPFDPAVPGFGAPRLSLQNTGSGSISYSVSTPAWLAAEPSSGTLSAGASISVSLNAGPNVLAYGNGNYSSTVSVTNTTNGTGNTSYAAALTVEPNAKPTLTYSTLVPVQ
jgi:hypothetical protein